MQELTLMEENLLRWGDTVYLSEQCCPTATSPAASITLFLNERMCNCIQSNFYKEAIMLKSLLREKESEALRIFSEKVRQELGDHLISIKLFGSKARGTDTPHSDLDVAIIVDEENLAYEDAVIDIAFEVNLDFDLYISPKIIPHNFFEHPIWRLSPFLKNIQKEGVEYWIRT